MHRISVEEADQGTG